MLVLDSGYFELRDYAFMMRASNAFALEGMPLLGYHFEQRYGCCQCLCYHRQRDGAIYDDHLMGQSKHGPADCKPPWYALYQWPQR